MSTPLEQLAGVKEDINMILKGIDWDQLEATQESLREHMALAKKLQERVNELEAVLEQKVILGQYMIDANGVRQGTIIGSSHWPKYVDDAGLTGQWMELVLLPVNNMIIF